MELKGRLGPILAIGILVAASVWMLSGEDDITQGSNTSSTPSSNPKVSSNDAQHRVQARVSRIETVERTLKLSGETQANTELTLMNQFAGTVDQVFVEQGQTVEAASAILTLDTRRLKARLNEAQALVRQRQLELQGIKRLERQNLSAQVNVATAESSLASAQAAQTALRIELEDATVRAPFAGIINDFSIKPGQWLSANEPVAMLLDITPLTIRLNVPQQDLLGISVGTQASVHIHNRELKSRVTYISAKADAATRSIPIELTIDNAASKFAAGLTANVELTLPSLEAHAISPALLQINTQGNLSLKTLNAQSRVVSKTVSIVKEQRDKVWVSGLSAKETLITVGQGFVEDGDIVTADIEP